MDYARIISPYKHSFHFKFFLDNERELQALVKAKIHALAAAQEPKYFVPGYPPGDINAISKHFGQEIYRTVLQNAVTVAVQEIITQEQLSPCTLLAVELMATEDQRLKYFCAFAKLPSTQHLVAPIEIIKPLLTVTDACIDLYLQRQRVIHAPQETILLQSGTLLAEFDMVRCLVFATNIPRYLNVTHLSCLLGLEQEYYAIEAQLIGKLLHDCSYTLTTPLGYITLLICQARRLKRVLSLEELQKILPAPAQTDLRAYALTTLKDEALKPSHVYLATTLMHALENLEDIDVCPQMLKKYTEQPASQSQEQDRFHYLQGIAHLLIYSHIPQEIGAPFQDALAHVETRTLIALGYMDAQEQYQPEAIKMRQILYQSLQYLAQDVRYQEKLMSLREFYQELATITTRIYR